MKLTNDWFTALSQNDSGDMIVISGRENMRIWAASGKFNERVEITWRITEHDKGMPLDKEAERMELVQEALQKAVEENKLAILTGIYTGGCERVWVFYTRNIPAFGTTLNEALSSFEVLPITIYTEKDPQWEEYFSLLE